MPFDMRTEESLALALIELRHGSTVSHQQQSHHQQQQQQQQNHLHQNPQHLQAEHHSNIELSRKNFELKCKIELLKAENALLRGMLRTADTVQLYGVKTRDEQNKIFRNIHKELYLKDASTQTNYIDSEEDDDGELVESIMSRRYIKEKIKMRKLKKDKTLTYADYVRVKRTEYDRLIAQKNNRLNQHPIVSPKPDTEIIVPSNPTHNEFATEFDSNDQHLIDLSVPLPVCGSIYPLSEYYREVKRCEYCRKTFSTATALNIHLTKKHQMKKNTGGCVLECPCGQVFNTKWRQNTITKLQKHGRRCQAFKEIEIACDACDERFISQKSLHYHRLKAHNLAVPNK